ncbi:hypothetical protein BC936DRAFT_146715 [Jimgerdemannia flammicorona]|uniref:Nuclease associated modular domain-containing protein n=1 Tax=Jimgerdemannia flammicorona TaxID=994334 RepID=A0A433D6X4_9FUNG|nr:hypothetical protein BC936DRAFT_146715 [Jimgerdemannia flammicorona]
MPTYEMLWCYTGLALCIHSGSSLGYRHTVKAKAAIGAAKTGSKHPNYGKKASEETKALLRAANEGENNPSFGKPSANRVSVSLWDLEGNLVGSFNSQVEVAKALGVNRSTVIRAIQRGYVIKGAYRISLSS